MARCSAPWYEINISAPDNIVSACCFYAGAKDPWQDAPVDINTYWNSKAMQAVRSINGLEPARVPNGCSSCFYFENRKTGAQYFDFSSALAQSDLSLAQRANLIRAREDFEAGCEQVSFTPLRIYANFGFACNLACGMCHQVPRRDANRRQVSADTLLAWHSALEAALDITVIGGEPFTLPEAIKFIRAFIADPAFEEVRLTICTNGTVHHKHMDALRRKRKLSMAVSLDSIGEGYEKIRVNGQWNIVERNILTFLEVQRKERPEWYLQTNALIQKTGIPLLPRFAEWHARHGIVTSFYDFINSRGTEDAYFSENVLHNPQLLDNMPEWEDYFNEAIATFQSAKLDIAANTLDHYRIRVAKAVAAHREHETAHLSVRGINAWNSLLVAADANELQAHVGYSKAPGADSSLFEMRGDRLSFTRAREGDHVATTFFRVNVISGEGVVRCRLLWRRLGSQRRSHVWLQLENGQELGSEYTLSTPSAALTEVLMIARLPPGSHRIRLVMMPVGEDDCVLPDHVELDFAETGLARQQVTNTRTLELTAAANYLKTKLSQAARTLRLR